MPYLLHVLKGKEKRVIEVFGHHRVAAKKALIGEYVVTYDPKCEELRYPIPSQATSGTYPP